MEDGICYVCGVNTAHSNHKVVMWNYGVRQVEARPMCKSCIRAEEKGEL